MASVGRVCKILSVAAIAGGVLALACPQVQSATNKKLFSEHWQQKNQCSNLGGSSGRVCTVVSAGKFTITAKFTGTGLSPSLLSTPGTQFDISLGGSSFGSGSGSSITGFSFQDANVSSDFQVGSSNSKTTATRFLVTQKCNAKGNICNANFPYEKIVLTISSNGDLGVSISAKTGSDLHGDIFENSIDAENFDGDATGPVSDSLFVRVDLGSFNFNDAQSENVAVTGHVNTKSGHSKGSSSSPGLSNVKIGGTFQQ